MHGKMSFARLVKLQATSISIRSPQLKLRPCHSSAVVSQNRSGDLIDPKQPFVIPKKKKRDSLSVLKCLASTVQKDPTAPNYMFLDDPYLIPYTAMEKTNYALSKASGRKAARFIIDNYPDAFKTDMYGEVPSVPHVEAFMPKKIHYQYKEASEEALKERIEMRKVTDAIDVYNQIKQEGLELSEETRLSLLHLLTVFNSSDPEQVTQLPPEEYKYRKMLGLESRVFHKTWKDNGAAEQVFADLPVKSSEAYCSMIKGFCKYLDTDKALQFFEAMKDQNMPIDVATYNEIIRIMRGHNVDFDSQWKGITSLLQQMKEQKVLPNVDTFLSVLISLKSCLKRREHEVFKVLDEMKVLNIEPTLGIYQLVMVIIGSNKNAVHPFLADVIDYLQDKKLEVTSKFDIDFFADAMVYCNVNLHDVELAHKVDALLHSRDNYKFAGDMSSELIYCKHYFSLVCEFESLDKIMEIYNRLIPHFWCPRIQELKQLVEALDLHDGYHYLPEIWSDFVSYNNLNKDILGPYFSLMSKKKHDTELQQKFSEIVDAMIEKWQSSTENRRESRVTGAMIGNFMVIKLHSERFEEAWSMFELYKIHEKDFDGKNEKAVEMLVEECIRQKDSDKATKCIQFMAQEKYPNLAEYEKRVSEEMELTDLERQHIELIR